MDLSELRSIQTDERQTDELQPLDDSFYQDVATYLSDLRDERKRVAEQVSDPFQSEEVKQLTDEIETIEDIIEGLYDNRLGKVVKQASLAAAGFPADKEHMTAEEAALFEACVDHLEQNRSRVLGDLTDSSTPTEQDVSEKSGANRFIDDHETHSIGAEPDSQRDTADDTPASDQQQDTDRHNT